MVSLYFAADEGTDAESLHQIGDGARGAPRVAVGIALRQLARGLDALLALGNDHPVTVVIHEFPYLARANPALPSILQNAIAPRLGLNA